MSAVVCAPQWAATCSRPLDASMKSCDRAPPLLRPNSSPSPVVPEGKHTVDAGIDQELDVGAEGVLVELLVRRAA